MVKIYLVFYTLVLCPTAPILDALPRQIQIARTSTFLKELIILSTINGNANIYTLRNREALLSPYRNLSTLQDLYKPQKTFTNSIQNYYSPILQKLEFKGGVLLRDTSVTPYARPPISTDLATKDRLRDYCNLRQSTAICRSPPYSTILYYILPIYFYRNIYNIRNVRNFCRILLSLPDSTKFCQNYNPKPILPRIRIN